MQFVLDILDLSQKKDSSMRTVKLHTAVFGVVKSYTHCWSALVDSSLQDSSLIEIRPMRIRPLVGHLLWNDTRAGLR